MPDRWIRDDELAEHLGISPGMVHKMMRQGMPSMKIGRARRFDPDACLAWLRERQ